jgi:2-hydroxycyclohexanecarboxyl-CoA dehydrogenase
MADTGKVVVVTGAARGIGRDVARRLRADGFRVAVWDIDEAAARAAADELGGLGVGCDVSEFAAVCAAADRTEAELGAPWGLVNNAGIDRFGMFKDSDPDDWRAIIDVNLVGALNVVKRLLDGMIEQGDGRIVCVSSDAGRVGSTGEAVYASAKAGLLGFVKSIARETARFGIKANAVCPGPTDTALLAEVRSGPRGDKIMDAVARSIPLARIAEPKDIAGAIAFFMSPDADYITGQTLSVSGGLTMV